MSPQFLQSLASDVKDDISLRSSMKEKKSKRVAFDEVFPHPERAAINPDREQFPCSFLLDHEEWKSWEVQSMISHKVAVM